MSWDFPLDLPWWKSGLCAVLSTCGVLLILGFTSFTLGKFSSTIFSIFLSYHFPCLSRTPTIWIFESLYQSSNCLIIYLLFSTISFAIYSWEIFSTLSPKPSTERSVSAIVFCLPRALLVRCVSFLWHRVLFSWMHYRLSLSGSRGFWFNYDDYFFF